MQVIQILAMNQQVQHVVALAADLQSRFNPIESRRLEELGRLERSEQVALLLRFRAAVLQRVQNVVFQKFLIAHAHFHRVAWRAVLLIPSFDERNINRASTSSRSHVEGTRRPQKCNSVGGVVSVQRRVLQKRLNVIRKNKLLVIFWQRVHRFDSVTVGDWIDERVEVECWQIGILSFDVHDIRCVIPARMLNDTENKLI